MRSWRYRVIAIFLIVVVVVTVFTPHKSLSVPLFESESVFASFFNSPNMNEPISQGIGGLEIRIERNFVPKPSNLSYRDGHLYADIKDKPVKVKVAPKILDEAIRVVQQTDESIFQVSIDQLAGRNVTYYTDDVLKDTEIGELFLDADSEFASIVFREDEQLLKNTPESKQPNYWAIRLLKDKYSDYNRLLKNWTLPPVSSPKIILSFNPNSEQIPGLVSLDFKPQVTFLSPYGHPLQAGEADQTLGELPYKQLMKDVKEHPDAYRNALPRLDDAASTVATMGLVAAGCRELDSCKHLQRRQFWMYSWQPKKLINEWIQIIKSFSIQGDSQGRSSQNESNPLSKLPWLDYSLEWLEHSLEALKPEKNAWDVPYNAVLQGINLNSAHNRTSLANQAQELAKHQAQELAKRHFKEYQKVPKHSLLQGALAVVDAWKRDWYAAEKDLNSATKLSADLPGDRFEVTTMGFAVASNMQNSDEVEMKGKWIKFRMNYLRRKALRASYDLVDNYLKSCEKKESKQPECSIENLLNWEANATRAGLYEEDVQGRDVAWLYGRFAYLVGVKLLNNQPEKAKDRLRFLSSYAKVAEPWHRWTLHKWENNLRKSLGETVF